MVDVFRNSIVVTPETLASVWPCLKAVDAVAIAVWLVFNGRRTEVEKYESRRSVLSTKGLVSFCLGVAVKFKMWIRRSANYRMLGAIVALAVLVWLGTYYWGDWKPLREWLTGEGSLRESGSATVRNLGLVVAGLIAIPLAWWRSRVAAKQADIAQQSLWNERYQKAAEMLGSNVLSVRLGGIYAFRTLVEEQPRRYYVQCMRLLCAFVRNPTLDSNVQTLVDIKTPENDFEVARVIEKRFRLRADVQAVMEMLRGRDDEWISLEEEHGFMPDLRGAELSWADLESVNLSAFDMSTANLIGADLRRAKLISAILVDGDLTAVRLSGADLSACVLRNANVTGTRFCELTSDGGFERPARGLTESSLQYALADFNNPPELGGVVLDSWNGLPLEWNGRTLYPGDVNC